MSSRPKRGRKESPLDNAQPSSADDSDSQAELEVTDEEYGGAGRPMRSRKRPKLSTSQKSLSSSSSRQDSNPQTGSGADPASPTRSHPSPLRSQAQDEGHASDSPSHLDPAHTENGAADKSLIIDTDHLSNPRGSVEPVDDVPASAIEQENDDGKPPFESSILLIPTFHHQILLIHFLSVF